jgi:PAS domain S-box-containing protein
MSREPQSQLAAEPSGSRLEFERMLADLSSRFVHLSPYEVDREIEDALRHVCEHLALDLAVLGEWSTDAPGVIVPTHAYPAWGSLRPLELMLQQHYPWTVGQMLAGRTVAVASLDELPAEAAQDRESACRVGVKSNLALPMMVGGEPPVGALAFSALQAERAWPEPLIQRLQLVAQVFTNALARKRHELSQRANEERLSLAADCAEAGLWSLDFGSGVFWATERARAILGYPPGEAVTLMRLEASVHSEDWGPLKEAIERSAVAGDPVGAEFRIVLPGTGDVRWVAFMGRRHRTTTGGVERLMGVSIDITERKRAEQAFRVSESRLASGAELAGLAYYEIDYGRGVIYVDDRFRDLCGLPPDRLSNLLPFEFWREHLHPDDLPRLMEQRDQMHAGKMDRFSEEYRYSHPARGERWFHHLACVAARDGAGRAVRTFGVLRDITTRRQAEESLRESLVEIERLKDRLQAESDYLKAEIGLAHAHGEVVGESTAIKRVLHMVEQVATTDASVLLLGETGTGKELIARAIHRLSSRRRLLMVTVNCAALPSGLIESELFGREKGAFTGALSRQAGRFEIADGSTLFLDEVGDLSLDAQAKLLRVLETGELERLGSARTIRVNVRVIAATNRNLTEAVAKKLFREDLYFRLSVFPIHLPPLRERVEDIPLLVWAFLGECCTRMGKKITQVPRATMDALRHRSWPGNIRELRNVIEHAAIVSSGDTLRVPSVSDAAASAAAPQTLVEVERAHILRTLERTGGRIKGPEGAAAALGLEPSTLYSRMKKLGIQAPR